MVRLHCFSQSGNCYKVALLLQALGEPWEPVFVDFFHGATRDPAWRERENEMGEVPILEDGPRRLTQSGVILTYLAEKHGAHGGRDADEKREVLRWILFDNHKFTSYLATLRFLKSFGPAAPDPTLVKWLAGRVDGAWQIVERHLASRDYLVGDGPTIADFSLAGYVYYPDAEIGLDLMRRHPHIAAWAERLQSLPGWKGPYDLLPGEQMAPKW